MSTRLSSKKVEDVACAILKDERLKAFHDILRAHLAPLISQNSKNPLLTNGANVSYSKEDKKEIMERVDKPKPTQMKPEVRLFNEKIGIDLVLAYKKANNIKVVRLDDKNQIVTDFRAIPANEDIWQGYVKDYNTAIDEYYEAIMKVTRKDDKTPAFKNNSLYTFNRATCEMSLAKKTTKTTVDTSPVPLRRTKTIVNVASDDEE
jgi:hypothetical protein